MEESSRKIPFWVIWLVSAVVLAAAAYFALRFFVGAFPNIATPAAPAVSHPLEGYDNCVGCHGPGGVRPFSAAHAGRTNDTCLDCHPASR